MYSNPTPDLHFRSPGLPLAGDDYLILQSFLRRASGVDGIVFAAHVDAHNLVLIVGYVQ